MHKIHSLDPTAAQVVRASPQLDRRCRPTPPHGGDRAGVRVVHRAVAGLPPAHSCDRGGFRVVRRPAAGSPPPAHGGDLGQAAAGPNRPPARSRIAATAGPGPVVHRDRRRRPTAAIEGFEARPPPARVIRRPESSAGPSRHPARDCPESFAGIRVAAASPRRRSRPGRRRPEPSTGLRLAAGGRRPRSLNWGHTTSEPLRKSCPNVRFSLFDTLFRGFEPFGPGLASRLFFFVSEGDPACAPPISEPDEQVDFTPRLERPL